MKVGCALRAIGVMPVTVALACALGAGVVHAQPAWPGDKPAATGAPAPVTPPPFPPAQASAPPPFPPSQGAAPPPFPPSLPSAPAGFSPAQGMGVPGGGGFSGGGPPGGGAASGGAPGGSAPGGPPPCFVEFQKLRGETEKRGAAAKAGNDRKATREEMCKLIEAYASAEAKWVSHAIKVEQQCSIPKEAITQLKASNVRSQNIRKQVCAAGAGPVQAGGQGPSLSEALGTTRLPTPETTRTGRGTFDTLTGNPLLR